ncbi:hypothetical protein [Roseibium sp.]|uniref:hypothetical protein n=1 Tax=Roseibium sp. TaxID=1936156 RepID=UPI003BAA5BFD
MNYQAAVDNIRFAKFVEVALKKIRSRHIKSTNYSNFYQLYSDIFDLTIIDLGECCQHGLWMLRVLHETGSGAGIIFVVEQHNSLLSSATKLGNETGSNLFVAGGVEGARGLRFTNDIQSDVVQGFLFARRMPPTSTITPGNTAISGPEKSEDAV